jgi:hypothetical protein
MVRAALTKNFCARSRIPADLHWELGMIRRIFGLLAMLAGMFGALLLLTSPESAVQTANATALQTTPVAYSGWAAGLCMGLCLAWLAGIEWAGLPARIFDGLRMQGRRVMMVAMAGLLVGIVLYF